LSLKSRRPSLNSFSKFRPGLLHRKRNARPSSWARRFHLGARHAGQMPAAPAFGDSIVLDGAPAKPPYWSFQGVYAVRGAPTLGTVAELVDDHRIVATPFRSGALVPAEVSGVARRTAYKRRWLLIECVATYSVDGTIPDAHYVSWTASRGECVMSLNFEGIKQTLPCKKDIYFTAYMPEQPIPQVSGDLHTSVTKIGVVVSFSRARW
jgi:hypothetical protein